MHYAGRIAFALAAVAALVLDTQASIWVMAFAGGMALQEFWAERSARRLDAESLSLRLNAAQDRIDRLELRVMALERAPKSEAADHSKDLAEFRTRLDRISIAVGLAHTLPKKGEA